MATEYTGNVGFANPDAWDCYWDNDWYRNQDIKDVVLRNLLSTNRVVSGLQVTGTVGATTISTAAGSGVISRGAFFVPANVGIPVPVAGPELEYVSIWVYVDGSGLLQTSLTIPTGNYLILAVVDCDQTGIVRIYDLRAMWNDPDYYDTVDRIISATDVTDVFIYDTTKDPDGGAWTDTARTQSWYGEPLNTETRGATRAFPKVVLIVATTTSVTLYDLTDLSVPMWMVFSIPIVYDSSTSRVLGYNTTAQAITITGVSIVKGVMSVSTAKVPPSSYIGGLCVIDFQADEAKMHPFSNTHYASYPHLVGVWRHGLASRNDDLSYDGTNIGIVLSPNCNDVAMTVLDGNDYPTIAVATDGGVSVIDGPAGKDTAVDITWTNQLIVIKARFNADNSLSVLHGTYAVQAIFVHTWDNIPSTDLVEGNGYSKGTADRFYVSNNNPAYDPDLGDVDLILAWGTTSGEGGMSSISESATGGLKGLTLLDEDTTTPANGMVAYITSTYNTGWQPGDIKLATLADSTEETIGADITTEHVVNGVIDDGYGWAITNGPGMTGSIAYGVFTIGPSNQHCYARQEGIISNGGVYRVQGSHVQFTGPGYPGIALIDPSVSAIEDGDDTLVMDSLGIFTKNCISTGNNFVIGRVNASGATMDSDVDDLYAWNAGAEEVTNGDFSSPLSTGWTDISTGTGTASIVGGQLVLTRGPSSSNKGKVEQVISGDSGAIYEIMMDRDPSSTASLQVYVNGVLVKLLGATGDNFATYKSTGTDTIQLHSGTNDETVIVDNVSIRKITDLIENGELSREGNITGWGSGWSLSSGVATHGGGYNTELVFPNAFPDRDGLDTIIQFVISGYSGYGALIVETNDGIFGVSADGVYNVKFTPGSTFTSLRLTPSIDFVGGISNIHVYDAELVNGTWQPVGNLIVNPSFEGWLDDTEWIDSSSGSVYVTVSAGDISFTRVDASNISQMYQEPIIPEGDMFELTFDSVSSGGGFKLIVEEGNGGADIISTNVTSGSHVFTFKAASATSIRYFLDTNGSTGTLNNISVKRIQSIVENGEFSSDRGWTPNTDYWTVGGGSAVFDGTLGGNTLDTDNNTVLAGGTKYLAVVDISAVTGTGFRLYVGDNEWFDEQPNGFFLDTAKTYAVVFECKAASATVAAIRGSSGATGTINSFEVYELSEPERSYNHNPLQVVGQIEKTPVYPGADQVAYSGFSALNFLEQPYNSDLDIGTGDFYALCWIINAGIYSAIVDRYDGAGNRLLFQVGPTGLLESYLGSPVHYESTFDAQYGVHFASLVRRSGTIYMGLDAIEESIGASSDDLTEVGTPLTIGVLADTKGNPFSGALSLLRLGAGAPTAEQIQKIYNSEKSLFQANAKSLLKSGDQVVDLSYDSTTDTHLVANTDGATVHSMDIFQGLNRIGSKDLAVLPTAIDHNPDKGVIGAADRVIVVDPDATPGAV